jgi:selenocysteine lyase/cysteine desulfurase
MTAAPVATRWPELVGVDAYKGPDADALRSHVNLDYAATTPALRAAADAVTETLAHYGSVHRGGGIRSQLTTDAYERARESVARFLDVPDDRVVVFVRNTTEAINLVAATLGPGSRILCSPIEHHANLLPWRSHEVEYLPFAASVDELVESAREALATGRFDLLALCGASNVTGEILPLDRLIPLAHAAGTEVLVDAAQLAPHCRVSVRSLDADYLAVSGHKLYAPFGTGALVVRRDALQDEEPLLRGGGAVRAVTLDDVAWADLPHRLEAGTPNVLGAIALAAAMDELTRWGFDGLEREEQRLAERLWDGLHGVAGCRVLRLLPDAERVAVASFVVQGADERDVATTLAEEYGVSVRSGLFCAHPLVSHLLGTPRREFDLSLGAARAGEAFRLRGAVRASIGIGVADADVDRLIEGVRAIAADAVQPAA